MDMLGDLGGVQGLLVAIFWVFLSPIAEFGFYVGAIKELYFINSKKLESKKCVHE
tara:strand:- start:1 stop:165 length:165 start_codon:yes stop_codon:yes gene_type:complete